MITAIFVIALIGMVAAVTLALADRFLSVKEDPRIGMITAELPGANCGGCGFAGCGDYVRARLSQARLRTAPARPAETPSPGKSRRFSA